MFEYLYALEEDVLAVGGTCELLADAREARGQSVRRRHRGVLGGVGVIEMFVLSSLTGGWGYMYMRVLHVVELETTFRSHASRGCFVLCDQS